MRLNKIFSILFLSISCFAHALLYDSAVYTAQRGNWKSAYTKFNAIIAEQPDNPDILYDTGIAAYNLADFNQAATYFSCSADCAGDKKDLAFRGHFNAAGAYVENNNLEGALERYDKALALEPNNEYARHNRDRVKQMIQEKEKQEKQNKNDDCDCKKNKNQNEQDKPENNQDQQKNENQQKNEINNDEQQSDQEQGNDQQPDNQQKQQGQGSDKKSQNGQKNGTQQRSKDTQEKSNGDQTKNNDNTTQNEKRNEDHKFNEESGNTQQKQGKQQGNEHDVAPGKQNDMKDNCSVAGEEDKRQDNNRDQGGDAAINDPWLLGILNDQELRDKAINKQLIEAKIRQHGGKNVQNCW